MAESPPDPLIVLPPAPPPPGMRQALRGLLVLRPAPPRRWWFSLRAALCIGAPIAAGVIAGDVHAGLLASLGGFTALYGSGRPFAYRARLLALVALSLAAAVVLGLLFAEVPWAVVPALALFAMAATWICNALQVGPPGAYLFLLTCAAAAAMPRGHVAPMHAALLVLGGGAFAWCVHMAGALVAPRGPERMAVSNAGRAVAAFVAAAGSPREDATRQAAALALHQAWAALVSQQPTRGRRDGRLSRLRAINRDLHLVFADALGARARGEPLPDDANARIERLCAEAVEPQLARAPHPGGLVPLGHPGAGAALLDALRDDAIARRVVLRVGVATAVAASLGAWFHLERAYWAVAAAVLMLHQGFDWTRTAMRALERLLGTWVGLLLAWAILLWAPHGAWLVATVMALQFVLEMLVVRHYALAAVFITAVALTIAGGGNHVAHPDEYLIARGVDTLVGCIVALLVFRALPPPAAADIPQRVARCCEGVAAVVALLARGEVTSRPAREARRDLQRLGFALDHAYEAGVTTSRAQRRAAERQWPAIAATQRLVYRTLSACWALERLTPAEASAQAQALFDPDRLRALDDALRALADAARAGLPPPAFPPLPPLLEMEVRSLRECLLRIMATPSPAGATP